MQKTSATRMEMLAKKAQIRLAEQGRELLEQKRSALMRELLREAESALAGTDALYTLAAEARQALARAEVVAGPEAVRSAAMATRGELALEVRNTNIMGVSVPVIEQKRVARPALGRGYSPTGTSVTIDEVASAFEAEVESIIQLAQHQLRLARLAAEIQGTSRRVNALEHVLIPRLTAERDYIQMALDEAERADHFRLKRVKQTLQRRHAHDTDSKRF
jgi:V/A-type H+-transporting ATPase subunit D